MKNLNCPAFIFKTSVCAGSSCTHLAALVPVSGSRFRPILKVPLAIKVFMYFIKAKTISNQTSPRLKAETIAAASSALRDRI